MKFIMLSLLLAQPWDFHVLQGLLSSPEPFSLPQVQIAMDVHWLDAADLPY